MENCWITIDSDAKSVASTNDRNSSVSASMRSSSTASSSRTNTVELSHAEAGSSSYASTAAWSRKTNGSAVSALANRASYSCVDECVPPRSTLELCDDPLWPELDVPERSVPKQPANAAPSDRADVASNPRRLYPAEGI